VGDVVITFGGTRVYSDGSSGVGGAKRWRSRGFDVPFNDPLHSAVRRIVYRKQRPQKRSTSGDDVIINGDGLVGEREGSVNLNVNPPRSDNRTAYSGEQVFLGTDTAVRIKDIGRKRTNVFIVQIRRGTGAVSSDERVRVKMKTNMRKSAAAFRY